MTPPSPTPPEVLVVGAGPAGLALAALLGRAGVAVEVFDRVAACGLADPVPDGRDIALTRRARGILATAGIAPHLNDACFHPIRRAEVENGRSPFALAFIAAGDLGHLVANHDIRRASFAAVSALPSVTLRAGARIERVDVSPHAARLVLAGGEVRAAPLLVAADGRFSATRRALGIAATQRDFGRSAIVCRMQHAGDHGGIARECFGYGGTLAVLPLADGRSSIVLTLPAAAAASLMAETPARFASHVVSRLDGRLGAMRLDGDRHAYPLVASWATRFVAPRAALLGDAAVGMHPVTAHGYNFGLYGAEALARRILAARATRGDPGSPALLAGFQREHRRATRVIYEGTNALVGLYTDERLPARVARGLLLRAAARTPPLTGWISRRLTG